MKVLSFGEILLRLASPGYTKLFQKDSLDATFCGGEANNIPNNDVESGKLNKNGYEYAAKAICERFGCRKVAVTLRESINASRNGWSGMIYDAEVGTANYSTHYDIDIVDRVGGGGRVQR